MTETEAKELQKVCGVNGEQCPTFTDWLNRIYILKRQLNEGIL